ncbi:hypothetical protein ABZ215_24985 [Amycolatopsis sp. NPDC006131]|uniref:hypothetical protein n=1 Tax=Amycolatopsis sp. NPDC006131 TaxID=3156731 RepID=UPI0033A3A553
MAVSAQAATEEETMGKNIKKLTEEFNKAADEFKKHGGSDRFNKAFEASAAIAKAKHAARAGTDKR